jgi:signal peptidase
MEALREHPIRLRLHLPGPTWGRAIRLAGWVVFVAVVAAWAIFLRPEFLGGPADYVIVAGHSMEPTLHTGDLVVARRQRTYRRGDVIAYHIRKGQPGAGVLIIHRIVGGSTASGFITQGDNRRYRDPWRPKARDIDGKWTVHVPRFGMLSFFVHTPLGFGLFGALVTFLVLRGGKGARKGGGGATASEKLGDDGGDP